MSELCFTDVVFRLHIFVPYASEFGFFLNPDRFLKSALLPFPAGHQSRPCTSLLAAVYLWGVCLSQDEALLAQERDYLVLALQLLAHELASDHPDKIMHSIQAEVLLAVYFFRAGRFLEGKYHASAATSLAISSGLHRIRSVTATNSILHTLDDVLPIPMDEVEEAGRIAGFWSVYVLNTCWSAVLRSPPSCAFDSPGLHIDTPWPLEFEQYKNVSCLFSYHQGYILNIAFRCQRTSMAVIPFASSLKVLASRHLESTPFRPCSQKRRSCIIGPPDWWRNVTIVSSHFQSANITHLIAFIRYASRGILGIRRCVHFPQSLCRTIPCSDAPTRPSLHYRTSESTSVACDTCIGPLGIDSVAHGIFMHQRFISQSMPVICAGYH